MVYELIQSWSAQAILLLLLGWLILAPERYHRQRFRDRFGAICSANICNIASPRVI